jgi:eukaryotic-like serine/threonine-protein kinase
MMPEGALRELAAAIVAGRPIDWEAVESSATDDSMRGAVRNLRLIATIADVHCRAPLQSDSLSVLPGQETASVDAAVLENGLGPDSQRWGPLQLLERVGQGTHGDVYRAWDTRLDREVALKLLHRRDSAGEREVSSVIAEARMLARVRHPNVATVYGADRTEGRVGLWMEFIHGRSLEHILRDQGPFSAREATLIGMDLCRALAAVHGAGLLHRDIKAHNVIREAGGRIVLMDFGTGLDRDDDSPPGLAGTPLYMAPEILGDQEPSVRSDIYSVGVLLYRLVTGSYPVQARSVQEVRDQHARGQRTFLRDARPDLPENFVQIVERALSGRPDGRYESAGAMEAALASAKEAAGPVPAANAIESLVTSSVQTTVMPRHVTPTTWRSRKLAIAAALFVLAGTGSLWLTARNSEPPVIAVLPFKNLSVEPNSDYFVDGLTDEVIRNLSVIDGLAVRSSTSSFALKNKPRNTREVGQQLNADLVLEASVLRAGTQLRINAQLVRSADDVLLWSERYDRELKDIFAIQDEISRSIVNELRLKLGRGQRRYTTNVEAYDLYLKGRVLQARRGPGGPTRQAIDLFEQVLAKDPTFAPAYAALASAYGWYLVIQVPSVQGLPVPLDQAHAIVRSAALKAIQLDPLLAEAHDAMGWVHSLDLEWAKAEESFRHALELNPSLTTTYTDFVISTLVPEGKLDEALRQLDVALSGDPLSSDVRRVMSTVQISAGLYDSALDNCRRVLAVDPGFPAANTRCEQALLLKGHAAEAIEMMEKFIAGNSQLREGGGRGYGYLGYAYAITGRRAEAEAQAAKNAGFPHQQAMIYGGLGDKDRAFEAIERLAAVNPQRALSYLTRPELALLRGDPRVAALRKKLGLPQ